MNYGSPILERMHEREEQLINFYRRTRRMPGYKELMKLWDFKSKNAVYKVIEKMVDAGIINKDRGGHIAPTESFNEIKMLGLVEAGIPTEAEYAAAYETVSIDELLVENREASYILRVKGESMIEAGIREGDMVIAERGSNANDGDIVIAEVDGGWTMKYFRRRGARIYLEPANIAMQPIYPEEELRIAAIVKAVIRKY
ncbi:MAG: LexA repressor [Parcubacteria group bacterium GW2011_GWF2_52_12]|nr:MAG: LexA repressor [Parcubacteria group bacterium GW2011_GWC1_51_35]KKW25247.1 MAG: LexA repressor [Parcubacteria group bacterium GW2011_GWF2_52_12]KKW28062.1 MAG: LexA repressor [Parcubacteria group bacterium GW2011_GWF1_52_5]KKW34668.1 MAG: LexA repressor [Parcubacteria group bacterium GW2011_GWB1_53_43]